jgi:hypothetical protein
MAASEGAWQWTTLDKVEGLKKKGQWSIVSGGIIGISSLGAGVFSPSPF